MVGSGSMAVCGEYICGGGFNDIYLNVLILPYWEVESIVLRRRPNRLMVSLWLHLRELGQLPPPLCASLPSSVKCLEDGAALE